MKYLPLKRTKLGRLPWGYRADDNDPYLLVPIAEQLNVLEKGFDMLDKGASLRRVTDYISEKAGVKISTTSVQNFYDADESRVEGRAARADLVGNYSDNNKIKRYKKLRPDEREALKLGRLKTRVTRKEKKLAKLRQEQRAVAEELASVPHSQRVPEAPLSISQEALETHRQPDVAQIVPNPGPQTEFLAAPEFCVLYGGAAGGGKSWSIIVDPLRTAHMPSHKAITFRRTNDELRDLIALSKDIYPKVIPGAVFKEQLSTWYFPNGGTHWYRYLDRDDDVKTHQGHAFSWVGFDELTQWSSPYVFDYMRSRCRTTDEAMLPFLAVRATANPGGAGHGWVKKFFIDPAPANTTFPMVNIETGEPILDDDPGPNFGKPIFYCKFIPARLSDNPYLAKGGQYRKSLLSLREVEKKQLLDGDWDVAEGAAFEEFNRRVHVCAPFDIPSHWTRFRGCDWGYSRDYACCLWFAVDNFQNLYVYRELYVRKMLAPDFADKILELEAGENISYGVLDRHCWDKRGDESGQTIAQSMINRGCLFRKADGSPGSRKASKLEVHRRLQVKLLPDEITGQTISRPNLMIFNNCLNLIRTLPIIPLDKNDPEDVDTTSEDHAYDALRYGCMSRPLGNAAMKSSIYRPVSNTQKRAFNKFGFPT